MLNEATQQWLFMLSLYGWIWIVPIIERLLPIRGQKFIRPGMINDLVHTYHRVHLHTIFNALVITWLISYAQQTNSSLFLQGGLNNVNWFWNCVALLFMGHGSFYVAHYFSHKIPFLWQFHRVHHSSLTLDSLSTSRFHIIDKALFAAPYLAMVTYFQPDPGLTLLFISFNDFWGRFGHGNIRTPHWLGYLMSTPKFHRWHHSNHPEAIDKNFSAEFNFLDWIFGTAYYPKDKLPNNFGDPNYSNNILVQHYRPFADIYKIAKKKGVMALFRKPQEPVSEMMQTAHE